MTDDAPDGALIDLLRRCDTPTVCNAIEVAQGRRGFAGYTHRTMVASRPGAAPLVGRARTARIASAAPDPAPADEVRARRMAYFRHMAGAAQPAVAVVEDVDGPAATGAWWGELHARIHRGFGLAGAVTNGPVRDLGDLPDDFPIVAGGIGPSHAFVHVVDVADGATILGARVDEGSLVHADRHGMVVVPPEVESRLAEAIATLRRAEGAVLDALRETPLRFETFERAWAEFERRRT